MGHYEHTRAGYTTAYPMQGAYGTLPEIFDGFLTIHLQTSNLR